MSKTPEEIDDVTEAVTICDALRHRQIEPETGNADLDYPAFACWNSGYKPRSQATRKKSFIERVRKWLRLG